MGGGIDRLGKCRHGEQRDACATKAETQSVLQAGKLTKQTRTSESEYGACSDRRHIRAAAAAVANPIAVREICKAGHLVGLTSAKATNESMSR